MSTRPEYNSKIRLMNAFAPVSFTEHMISPISLIAPFANSLEWILRMLGLNEFLPDSVLMDFLGATICDRNSPIKGLCSNVLFILCGYNSAQLNATMLPIIMGHTPAGASVRSLVHYAQGVNNGAFRQYNHGKEKNLERYGQEVPPDYDLSKITAPVALYWGENDWLGVKADVSRLAELLPNLQRKYRIPDDHFNHLDFLFAKDVDTLMYETVENFMKLF
jgi:lysosomal acid lipase/cholesteryl ester hydrolase